MGFVLSDNSCSCSANLISGDLGRGALGLPCMPRRLPRWLFSLTVTREDPSRPRFGGNDQAFFGLDSAERRPVFNNQQQTALIRRLSWPLVGQA